MCDHNLSDVQKSEKQQILTYMIGIIGLILC